MGQYRQWLHTREVDQQLKARLEALEEELKQIYNQADLLAATTSCTDNKIIQILARSQKTDAYFTTKAKHSSSDHTASAHLSTEQPKTGVSPALFAWSRLPNFDSQVVPTSSLQTKTSSPLLATSHSEIDLLPKDIATFASAHTQAVSQIKLPKRPHKTVSTSASSQHSQVDQQSSQINYNVQRWLERWRRYPKMLREDQG